MVLTFLKFTNILSPLSPRQLYYQPCNFLFPPFQVLPLPGVDGCDGVPKPTLHHSDTLPIELKTPTTMQLDITCHHDLDCLFLVKLSLFLIYTIPLLLLPLLLLLTVRVILTLLSQVRHNCKTHHKNQDPS